jgi:hypothetical protein
LVGSRPSRTSAISHLILFNDPAGNLNCRLNPKSLKFRIDPGPMRPLHVPCHDRRSVPHQPYQRAAAALAFCATGAANKEDEDPQANANTASPAKTLIESILSRGEHHIEIRRGQGNGNPVI